MLVTDNKEHNWKETFNKDISDAIGNDLLNVVTKVLLAHPYPAELSFVELLDIRKLLISRLDSCIDIASYDIAMKVGQGSSIESLKSTIHSEGDGEYPYGH